MSHHILNGCMQHVSHVYCISCTAFAKPVSNTVASRGCKLQRSAALASARIFCTFGAFQTAMLERHRHSSALPPRHQGIPPVRVASSSAGCAAKFPAARSGRALFVQRSTIDFKSLDSGKAVVFCFQNDLRLPSLMGGQSRSPQGTCMLGMCPTGEALEQRSCKKTGSRHACCQDMPKPAWHHHQLC